LIIKHKVKIFIYSYLHLYIKKNKMSTIKKIIFIAWNEYHARNESISQYLKIDSYHIGKHQSNKIASAISFIKKSIKTLSILIKENPDVLIITNNAWVLPALSIIYCKIKKTKLIFDTHSSGISGPNITYPNYLKKKFAKNVFLNIVTNTEHAKVITKWGGKPFVLPDPPLKLDDIITNEYKVSNKINICYINTYSSDEPYNEVVNSVKNLNNITLYITGNYKNKNIKLINNENIIHTGFLNRSQYIDLLKKSDIIMTLTTQENTFQCGANEALSLAKPLITSNTNVLMNYFYKGTIFVNPNDENSIKDGIVLMIQQKDKFKNEMMELKYEKEREAINKVNKLINLINKG